MIAEGPVPTNAQRESLARMAEALRVVLRAAHPAAKYQELSMSVVLESVEVGGAEGGGSWPLAPAREWSRLGRKQGRLWRKLCNDLLSPDPSLRPEGPNCTSAYGSR